MVTRGQLFWTFIFFISLVFALVNQGEYRLSPGNANRKQREMVIRTYSGGVIWMCSDNEDLDSYLADGWRIKLSHPYSEFKSWNGGSTTCTGTEYVLER